MKEGKIEKIKREKEKILDLNIDLELNKEDFEKWKYLEDEVESALMGLELTEEEIEQGFEPVDLISLKPINYLNEEISDFENLEDEEKARRVVLKRAFETLGFNQKKAKLIKEEMVKATEEGKEDFVEQYFETENPDLLIVYNGKNYWVKKKEDKT